MNTEIEKKPKKIRCFKCNKGMNDIEALAGHCSTCKRFYCSMHMNRFSHGCEEIKNKIVGLDLKPKVDKI